MKEVHRIQQLLADHETYRGDCLNLTASENVTSPPVRTLLGSDLLHRYADYDSDPRARKYMGTRVIQELESEVAGLASRLFDARFVDLRPIGGHIACMAGLLAALQPGDTVMEVSRDIGGHRTAAKLGLASVLSYRTVYFPVDYEAYNIDVARSVEAVRETRPRLLIFGSSNFLFPHPISPLVEVAREVGAAVAYDGSHVFGLIAGRTFQDPLGEGADFMMGSTHKTLPGPQGGILITNSEEWASKLGRALYPPLVTNHHPFRIPSLGVCLAEMLHFGQEYASQVVSNAQTLGSELARQGVPLVGEDRGFTRSHTLVLKVDRFGSAEEVARRMEEANIITNALTLPAPLGQHGIRIGVQELTRLGATEADMAPVATMMTGALQGSDLQGVRQTARAFRRDLPGLRFCFDGSELAASPD